MIEKMYVNLIKKGRKTIDDVPEELREVVASMAGVSVVEVEESLKE